MHACVFTCVSVRVWLYESACIGPCVAYFIIRYVNGEATGKSSNQRSE